MVNGTEFSWEVRFQALAIITKEDMIHYSVNLDGSIKSYSFGSVAGNGNAEAAKTIRRYETRLQILSEDFRQTVIADYLSKKPALDALNAEYELISHEIDRREKSKNPKLWITKSRARL